MAAFISTSSLGHDQYYSSNNKLDKIFELPRYKRYLDFSSYDINNSNNNNNKRLKFGHDDDTDRYSSSKFDEIFKLPRYTRYFDFSSYDDINDPSVNNVDSNNDNNNKRLKFGHDDNTMKVPYCLKMVAGCSYLPKDNPKKPLGEDANFIHEESQTVGVADGVGGWANKGIDAGIYARELMKNSFIAINNNESENINPKRVLQQAFENTNNEGSSTACIITLNSEKNTISAVNVGDSGFYLMRTGKIIYKSSIQQRGFGCPYQLGKCKDNPNVAQEMELLNVKKDDILIVGTDGLFHNVNESEIEEIVRMSDKLKAKELAEKIGNIALYNSFDRFADTPYAKAAKRAGLSHSGGKIDDITVIVAYIY